MGAIAGFGTGIHLHRVAGNDAQLAGEGQLQFGERGQAAPVALDRDQLAAGAQDRAGQAAGAGADLERGLILDAAGNGGDPVEQLFVEQEILAKRLAGLKPMGGDHVAQRRQSGAGVSRHRQSVRGRLRPPS